MQQALLKEVDQSRIRVGKKLENVEKLISGKLRITFAGGFSDEVDLVVGADGIRSVSEADFPYEKRWITWAEYLSGCASILLSRTPYRLYRLDSI